VLRRHRPDVVGLQEALRFQLDEIGEALPQYGEVGAGRDDGERGGEYCAMLYLRDRMSVDQEGTFWLSDTPAVPGSATWGNTIPRACTWARFLDRTAARGCYVFNTHLDHASQPARELGARLIMRRIEERSPADPFLLTGDFNADEDNPVLRYLLQRSLDAFRACHPGAADAGTFHSFTGNRRGARIDYILVAPTVKVLDSRVVHDNRRGRYPSDHFPVAADVALP
jgi:endonuclease/exonuclease/phosphatase family metal-dependent hydrolase